MEDSNDGNQFYPAPDGHDANSPFRRHDERWDAHDGSRADDGCARGGVLGRGQSPVGLG